MARQAIDAQARKYIDEEIARAGEMLIGAWLLVLTGEQKGEDFRLREGKNTVGSDPGCDVPLTDGYVSKKHANITIKRTGPTSARFRVVDLDSANGTYLNTSEEPIHAEELVDNDTIRFGKVRCRFKCVG